MADEEFFIKPGAQYQTIGWGILNNAGGMWTPRIFDTPKEAFHHIATYERDYPRMDLSKHTVVQCQMTVEPIVTNSIGRRAVRPDTPSSSGFSSCDLNTPSCGSGSGQLAAQPGQQQPSGSTSDDTAFTMKTTGVDVETKSAVGSDHDRSRSPSTVSRINAEHGEDRGGRDDNAEAGKRPCVLGLAENRGPGSRSQSMADDGLSSPGRAGVAARPVNLLSSPDLTPGPEEPECAACGGAGLMGPFFPGGLSTICGNCTPTSSSSGSGE